MGTCNIAVPATSANLGPGFDSLGLAVPKSPENIDLYDKLEVAWGSDADLEHPVKVIPGGLYKEFGDKVSENTDNMVYALIRDELQRLGASDRKFSIICHNNIPHSRGLGSSSAAIVSALKAAYAILGIADEREIFKRANEIEGHPDNVAPCVYGGLQLASPDGLSVKQIVSENALVSGKYALDIRLQVNANSGLKTSSAREVLPAQIPFEDALANSRNLANLIALFCAESPSNTELFAATKDYLHQEYRRKLYPESMQRVDILRENGIPAMISGAGTSVIAFWFKNAEGANILNAKYAELFATNAQGITRF